MTPVRVATADEEPRPDNRIIPSRAVASKAAADRVTTTSKKAIKVNPDDLKRPKRLSAEMVAKTDEPQVVSQGPVDKAIDLAFNPTREKLREVTIIDRIQGRLFPLLDVVNRGCQYVLEVALYRKDPVAYAQEYGKDRPIQPNLLDEMMYRTAQWQKSIQGVNLGKITDLALAEMETRSEDDEDFGGDRDSWKE